MGAIFKRETRAYITNIIGCAFIAVSIAVMGFFVLFTNLVNAVPQIEYGLLGSVMAFIITIPVLCMLTFSAENKTGSVRLLLSLPISTPSIVLGKYLAAITMLAIPTAVMAIVPLFLSAFGGVMLSASYISVLGYFLIGASLIAICTFISAQTRHWAISLTVSIVILLLLYAGPTLSTFIPVSPIASLIAILTLELAVALLVWLITKKAIIGTVLLAISAIPTAVIFFLQKNSFSALFERIVRFISPFERFSFFSQGIFRLTDVIYLLSIIAVFLFFTYRTLEKMRTGEVKITSRDSAEARSRYNALTKRSALVTAVTLLLLFAVNLGVCALPAGYMTLDASGYGMYTVSEKSIEYISKLDEDVTVYFLCERGIPDAQMDALLCEYETQSKHIDYKVVDITANPEFLLKYAGIAYDDTDDEGNHPINNYSIIIESDKRYTIVDSSRFYHYRIGSESYTELEFIYYCEQAASEGYDISAITYSTYFDLDKVTLSGIEYVTLPSVDTVFTLTGHGERPLTEKFYENLTYSSVVHDDICLDDYTSIPDHCSALIIVSPATDLSESDADKIISYMKKGGDVILITSPSNAKMENLLRVTKEYGLTAAEGVIHDVDPKYHTNNDQTDLILKTNSGHGIVSFIKSQYGSTEISTQPRFPSSHPVVKVGGTRESVTVTEMLATSDSAALAVDGKIVSEGNTYFTGYGVEEIIDEAKGNITHLFWYSSYEAFTDAYIPSNPINQLYLLVSVSYLGAADEFETSLAIDSCNVTGSFLDIEQGQPVVWGIAVGLISILVLCMGIAIYTVRRKRKRT